MDHMRFKANLTAASYVANGLDQSSQEDFELHLMSCAECIDDVEAWRAIEAHMPREEHTAALRMPVLLDRGLKHWRLAASVVGIGILAAAGGWYGRAFADPELERTAFFNALPVSRGALECMPLRFAADTQRVVLRIAGVARDQRVRALSPKGEELTTRGYGARRQSDGSWLLQFATAKLDRGAIRLESYGSAGVAEPLGCVSAEPAP
jgi:hypothetical protein